MPESLVWSIATRTDPGSDLIIFPEAKGHPIDPSPRSSAGGPLNVVTGKWATDATKPPQILPQD